MRNNLSKSREDYADKGGKTVGSKTHTPRKSDLYALKLQKNMALMTNARNAAAVREPTIEDLVRFRSLEDVVRWAGLIGDIDYRFSQAGALLFILDADGYTSPAEFASIAPTDFKELQLLIHLLVGPSCGYHLVQILFAGKHFSTHKSEFRFSCRAIPQSIQVPLFILIGALFGRGWRFGGLVVGGWWGPLHA